MPQMLRMPSKADLPDGTRREFVAELFIYFKEAGRPTPARICRRPVVLRGFCGYELGFLSFVGGLPGGRGPRR
ncbi:hypothetical protein ABZ760_25970, partial [Streptomyces sp. NPDC006658]|uniref:hypothetical protein n=1 Tax=Streptomyces sp. NPDC006658 TaxID=3156900 RepID=UPI0033ECE98B